MMNCHKCGKLCGPDEFGVHINECNQTQPPTSSDWLTKILYSIVPDKNMPDFPDSMSLESAKAQVLAHLSQNYRSISSIREAIGEDVPDIVMSDDSYGTQVVQVHPNNELRSKILKALNLDSPQSKGGEND